MRDGILCHTESTEITERASCEKLAMRGVLWVTQKARKTQKGSLRLGFEQ